MAGETINFDGGESLATLGFINISGLTNTNGVGESGSYALHGDDRFDEAEYPVSPSGSELCLSFWWNRTVTNGDIYLFEAMAGTSFLYNVSLQVVSGSTDGIVDSRAGYTETVTDLWGSDFPCYVRIYIKPSTGGSFASPDSDGVVTIWRGASLSSLTQVYSSSAIPIYDFTKDSKPAYNRFHFAPQGDIDNIVWADSACTTALTDIPEDTSSPCCAGGAASGSSAGGLEPGGDPTAPTQPWTAACSGGGTVPSASAPTAGETWD